MDPRLLDYYTEQLRHMRELAREFARQHPRIAGRLGTQAPENADPYVKLLIESFCMMSARTQIKLDAEFPKFAGRLLEVFFLPELCGADTVDRGRACRSASGCRRGGKRLRSASRYDFHGAHRAG